MSAYVWKSCSFIRADADEAGRQFEELERTVGLTPETVLDANRDETAPLHNEFEWDDGIAAEKFRLNQAGHLIRCICAKPEKEEQKPMRVFFTVQKNDGYNNLQTIIQIQDKRKALLEQALKELDAFMEKYKSLSELANIFDAIERERNNAAG